jgi:polyhydroxybutyrate depolymerase
MPRSLPPDMRASPAILGLLAGIWLTSFFPSAAPASAADLVISRPDGQRDAIVVPAGPGPRPTVIVLHGATITPEATRRASGFAEAAARYGFTSVFPRGLRRQWNDGRTGGGGGADDVGFLRNLVAHLVADGVAIAERIYLAGISNGGAMSFALVCKAPDLFAGIGTVIAAMPDGIGPCEGRPMPLVMVNGTADPVVPYDGGEAGLLGNGGLVWSIDRTAQIFVRRNSCGAPRADPLPDRARDDGTTATRLGWNGCRSGAPVILYRIEGGGHQVPGAPPVLPRILGPGSQDISAADEILRVFALE